MDYELLFVIDGVSIDDDAEVSTLAKDFDALISWHRGVSRLAVATEGANAVDAVQKLLPRITASVPPLRLLRLDPELVGVADIGERTDRSRQNVQQWVDGTRQGDTPFPAPEGTAGRSLVWRWADVNAWLKLIGLGDGETRPTRDEAFVIDAMLFSWRQARANGEPMMKFVVAGDERADERKAVMDRLSQAVLDPMLRKALVAVPRENQHQLTVVCSVLLDPLRFVAEQLGAELSGVLAVMTTDSELRLVPFARALLPGAVPISELGLGSDATVGDLILAQIDSSVSPASPLVLA